MTMDVDDILKEIGEFGPYQRAIYVFMSCAWIPGAFQTLLSVFVNRIPEWECTPCVTTPTHACAWPVNPVCGNATHDKDEYCHLPDGSYYFTHPDHTATATLDLICDQAWKDSLVPSAFFVGYFFGCGVFGAMADRYGRRISTVVPAALSIIFSALSALVSNYWLYLVLRALVGFGTGGFGLCAFVLGNEFVGPSYRSATGTMASAFFSVGEIILAFIAWLVPDWRLLTIVITLTQLPYLFLRWLVPESPRYLLAAGRKRESLEVLRKVARRNGRSMPDKVTRSTSVVHPTPLPDPFSETESERTASWGAPGDHGHGARVNAADAPCVDSRALVADVESRDADFDGGEEDGSDETAKYGASTVLRHPVLRARLLIMLGVWFANSFGYYGLSLNTGNLGGSLYVNLALSALVEVPALPLSSWLLDRLGRKRTTGGLMIIAGAACMVGLVLPDTSAYHVPRLAAFLAGKFCVAGSFAVLYVYGVELFPTVVRSVAVGMSSQSARLGGVVAPGAVYLSHLGENLPFLAFGAVLLAAGASVFCLPETLRLPLMQTLDDVDGHVEASRRHSRRGEERLLSERTKSQDDTPVDDEEEEE